MIDVGVLTSEIARVNRRLRAHGGGIDLIRVSEAGVVDLRFTGMCCGCPYKALTWNGTVRAILSQVPGVSALTAPGVRISEEAEARLIAYTDSVAVRTSSPVMPSGRSSAKMAANE